MSEVFVRARVCGRNVGSRHRANHTSNQWTNQIPHWRTNHTSHEWTNQPSDVRPDQVADDRLQSCWWAEDGRLGQKKAENIHKITQGVVPMSIWTNHKPKILNGLEDSLVKVWVGRDWLTQTFTPGGGPLPPHVPPTIIPSYPVSSPHHQVAHKKCSNALQPQLCRNNSCCISL